MSDHELEHAVRDAGKNRFTGTIAVTTAILASVGIALGGLALAHV